MKVLLVNKFHYIKGGSETYYFGLGKLLEEQGIEVVYFSMKDKKNVFCKQEKYLAENVDFNAHMGAIKTAKAAARMLYSLDARRKFEQLIKDEKPDIIHLNIFQSQLTASIVDVAYKHHIPIVYTAHDLKSICPNYQMLNHGKVCEKCLHGNYWNCFKNGCMKDSKAKSFLATIEAYVYRLRKTYKKIDMVITPSAFYKKKIEEAGIVSCPVVHMTNFLPGDTRYEASKPGDYFLYFGRLSREKGILTLVRAYAKAQVKKPLYIVGEGPVKTQIEQQIKKLGIESKVKLLGFKKGQELKDIVRNSCCVCLPSEWYENGPYSIMEAMAVGKPGIVSDMGGLPELVEHGKTGAVAHVGNVDSLAEAIVKMEKEVNNIDEKYIVSTAEKRFSAEEYGKNIIRVYRENIR